MSTFDSVPDTFWFLDLPREIRDQVHEITLNGEVASPAQLNQRNRSLRHARGLETQKRRCKMQWSVARAASAGHDRQWAFVQQPVFSGEDERSTRGVEPEAWRVAVYTKWIAWRRMAICSSHGHAWQSRPIIWRGSKSTSICSTMPAGKGAAVVSKASRFLLCLLGQFFAFWPNTQLQGSLRSALKVDELEVILVGCMKARGSS